MFQFCSRGLGSVSVTLEEDAIVVNYLLEISEAAANITFE